jgi:hypothetical protein
LGKISDWGTKLFKSRGMFPVAYIISGEIIAVIPIVDM